MAARYPLSVLKIFKKSFDVPRRSYGKAGVIKSQKSFQLDNDVPIHLKGGFGDRALFGATIGLVIIGVGLSYYTLVSMAIGKKK